MVRYCPAQPREMAESDQVRTGSFCLRASATSALSSTHHVQYYVFLHPFMTPPLLSQSVRSFCMLKGTTLGYCRGTHGLKKNGRAPRGELHAASRQFQGGYAMARRSVLDLIRVFRAFRGEMVGIYQCVAVVYHHVYLGPRYASTSCQVILSWSLPTSMARLDWCL